MSLQVDIRKDFKDFRLHTRFSAENGITCLLGASGSGKSVTLKCIAGLITPDCGHIELDGVVFFDSEKGINLTPQERRVGYLFQNYALFPHMTVYQNLTCGMRKEKDRKERDRKIREMLTFLQLSGLETHYPSELSGGQAQRAALARILLNEPKLLLLDEPFSALDYHLKDKLMPEMKQILGNFPHGVLMVTHSRKEAYAMAEDAAVIQKGQVRSVKPVKKLFADPETIEAAILTGCKNIVEVTRTGEREVYVPDWGITLETGRPVTEDICAVGIRAHFFHENSPRNRKEILFAGELEEPFEWIVEFRYKDQKEETPSVWWRMAKDRRPGVFPTEIGISPSNIMLLRR